jgi:hypothetical protein
MKKISSLFILVIFLAISIKAQNQTNIENPPVKTTIKWVTNDTIDMGQLKQNNPSKAVFKFKNTGNNPLIISSARGSCGCTNVNWTKEPIKPGEEGFVEATYNAASLGNFFKTVTVKWNAEPENIVLVLKGNVVAQ